MKIKYRITILFTILVTGILLLLCVSIFYFSELNRENEFRKRLRNRAITTVSLLIKVPGIDKHLLKKIDESTLVSLEQKSVTVYDQFGKQLYQYTDDNTAQAIVNKEMINQVKEDGELYFTENIRDAVVLTFNDHNKMYIVVSAAFDADGREKIQQLKWILVFSLVTGIIITFVSGWFFSEGLVKPIKKIAHDVKEISSQNLSRRIHVQHTGDELNALSSTFNNLLDRLQESFEIQGRFISNASHELSTPLTSVLSQLEITLQNERPSAEYREVMYSVYEDVRNLSQLTKSLLDIARAGGSSSGIELLQIRIDELIMRLPADLKKVEIQYQAELHFEMFPEHEEQLLIFGNADLLYSAVKNITVNACKFSFNKKAQVSLQFTVKQIEIVIEDDGPGIPDEDIPNILQPFYRGKQAHTIQGFGLGLSLASRIIKIHKGTLSFMNREEGGTKFMIKLPVADAYHLF